ncbi:MAG: glycosyltransferase family 2 protein [Candidatus Latescibacterota bacterium]
MTSIVIPHYNGSILSDCLAFLYQRTFHQPFEVIVVDDGSTDGSVEDAQARFSGIRVLRNARNRGFAATCNRGISAARGRYVVLLNNDVAVQPGWLSELVQFAEAHERMGACQPKILSVRDRTRFDYSGAAGGLMDIFGYPFCLGRMFGEIEEDRGQYDTPREIFWASGTALFLRRDSLKVTGLLDERFYMHVEEIDLCWRMHLAGYAVWSVPGSVVWHHSGWTLSPERFFKMFLNHRNTLMTLLKNYSFRSLAGILPQRFGLECATILASVAKGNFKRAAASICGMLWVIGHLGEIGSAHRRVQRMRRVSDVEVMRKMFRGSIALRHFLSSKDTEDVVRGMS